MKSIIIFVLLSYFSCQILAESSCFEHKDFSKFTHCISKRETSKCYNGGCITCIKGRCMLSCLGDQCESCPTGSCCDGKNCNICIEGVCCKNNKCNTCIHECKQSCLNWDCRISCTQSCIAANKPENENVLNDENVSERIDERIDDDYEMSIETDKIDTVDVVTPCSQSCTGSCSTGTSPCASNCGRNTGSSCSSGCNTPCSSSCTSTCNSGCSRPCASSCGSSSCTNTCNSGCSSRSNGCSRIIDAIKPSCSNGCLTTKQNKCQWGK